MIKVVTNSLGSGDWVVVKDGNSTVYEKHSLSLQDVVYLLQEYSTKKVELIEVTDEQIEEGEY